MKKFVPVTLLMIMFFAQIAFADAIKLKDNDDLLNGQSISFKDLQITMKINGQNKSFLVQYIENIIFDTQVSSDLVTIEDRGFFHGIVAILKNQNFGIWIEEQFNLIPVEKIKSIIFSKQEVIKLKSISQPIPKRPLSGTECIEQITEISNNLTLLLNRLTKATNDFMYQRITQKRYIKETRDIYQKSNRLFTLSMDIVGKSKVVNKILGNFSYGVALYSNAFLAANDVAKNPTPENINYVILKLKQAQNKTAKFLGYLTNITN